MKHYNYQKNLQSLWESAVEKYRSGTRGAENFFNPQETEFLASIGLNAQEMFDFAEDFAVGGEPDFATVATIQHVRRAYLLEEQQGKISTAILDPGTLPSKQSEAAGIQWLPRIIPKAKAKLRGELHPDVMYCCGGDRHFLKTNDIHPAEFLRIVWDNEDNDQAIIDWVVNRSKR